MSKFKKAAAAKRNVPQTIKTILTDFFATVLCLAGATSAFYFFWTDLNKSLTKLNEAPIASVYDKERTAQRRFGDRVVWDVLQINSPVYKGDVIHTAALSVASIRFRDTEGAEQGNGFDLAENSLIQIFDDRIELANGKIDIRTGSRSRKLRLISAGTTIEIGENSAISANSAEAGGGNIQVLEGNAKITTSDGVQEAAAGEALSVSADGRKEIVPQVALLSPRPNQSILMSLAETDANERNVRFTWHAVNFEAGDLVRLEIALDQRFSQILQKMDVENASEKTVSLEAGVYWWRAYPARDGVEREVSKNLLSNKFSLVAAVVPKPTQPADGSTVQYYGEIPPVRLQWTSGGGDSARTQRDQNFLIEAADNAAMRNPRFRQEVRGQNYYVAANLLPGKWYWQVRTIPPEGSQAGQSVEAVSRPVSFALEERPLVLTAPRLISPADGGALVLEGGAVLSWRAEAGAAAYNFQLSLTNDFSAPVLDQRPTANFTNLTAQTAVEGGGTLRDGQYYWRVSALDAKGTASPFSASRSFLLSTAPSPVELIYPRDNWVVTETALSAARFSWKLNSSGSSGSLRMQVSDTASFAALRADIPASGLESAPPLLAEGNYFWRMAWTSADGARSFYTPSRRFTVAPSVRVTLESPAANAEIPGDAMLREPQYLRWSSSEPVFRSRLIVAATSDVERASSPVLDIANPPRAVPLPALREGVYYWTVKAETQGGVNISPAQSSSFRVGPVALLRAVSLQTPRSGWTLTPEILRSSREIRFAWSASQAANGYVLSIYRPQDRSRAAPVFRTQVLRQTNLTFNELALLDAGDFVWSVEPVFTNPAGAIEQRGEAREASFTVNIKIPKATETRDEKTFGF
jgi:hypothetical protein